MYLSKKIFESCFFCEFQKSVLNISKIYKIIIEQRNTRFFSTSNFYKGYETESRDIKEVIQKLRSHPHLYRDGYRTLLRESQKYFEEKKNKYSSRKPCDIARENQDNIDIAFKFETAEDLKLFFVTTDQDNKGGFSTASLKLTENKTALFSGNLSTAIPKNSKIERAGYVNFMCVRKKISFNRIRYYDWSHYSHLVLKIRGDGRPWMIILATPDKYKETCSYQFCHPLYTRGGPYWQITKIPFSHFFFTKGTKISQKEEMVPLNQIARIGFTLSDNRDGPFKFEIDYIGLENFIWHERISPYESYYERAFFL